MPEPQFVGSVTERQIFLLTLDTIQATFAWQERKGKQFACVCAMDARLLPDEQISAFCSQLIGLGCAYFCSWGPDCERVHDIMDREVTGNNPPETDLGCLMTTWHAEESLAEAVDYFLTCTIPDEEYSPRGCAHGLAIAIGSGGWATEIERHIRSSI